MTVEQYMINRLTDYYDGEFWGNLSGKEKELLGEWRADKKKNLNNGDVVELYNELCFLSIKGVYYEGYYYPTGGESMKKVSKRKWLKVMREY